MDPPYPSPEADCDPAPSHAEIERCARELWIRSGCPRGRDEAIWLEAERRLIFTQRAVLPPTALLIAMARSRQRSRLTARVRVTWTR